MNVNGTLINYYFHCKRQCYYHGNKINMEDNDENVRIGKAIHELEKEKQPNKAEIKIDNIVIDKLDKEYIIEIKKSDADPVASRWQVYLYLYILKTKGIIRKGKIKYIEKNKATNEEVLVLNEDIERQLLELIKLITELIENETAPAEKLKISSCKKCAYYTYCYI